MARYRSLPEERRRQVPDLLNSLGKLQVAAGDFGAARRDFETVAATAPEPSAKAEVHYNAYRAALEEHEWEAALSQLMIALKLDVRRFAPLPITRYWPLRILGAGSFGVAFLCEHRHLKSPVVLKALMLDDLDREVDSGFDEARLLSQLDGPAFVRI